MTKKIILIALYFGLISCQENSLNLDTTKWIVYNVTHNNRNVVV